MAARKNIFREIHRWPARLAIRFIRLYQITLSPWVGNQCRFHPTCSHYAQQAIELHGLGRGLWLAMKRLGKCHPYHAGGVDLVPQPAAGQEHQNHPV